MRLLALAIVLFSLYGLTTAEHWHQALSAASVCMWAGLFAVAPRGLYDGRVDSWAQAHKVRSSLVAAVFLSAAGYLAFSGIADDWKFGLTIVVGVVCLLVARKIADRRTANADEGPASGVDGGPSSRE
jgi:hypothetical protein